MVAPNSLRDTSTKTRIETEILREAIPLIDASKRYFHENKD